jgi:hypothetical protein
MVEYKIKVIVIIDAMCIYLFFYCRFITPGVLTEAAINFMEAERKKEYDRSDPNRGNLFLTLHRDELPDNHKDIEDVDILEDMIEKEINPKGSFRSRDRNLMAEFIKRNSALSLPNLRIDTRGYMIGRAPLLSYLLAESYKDHTNWMYPSASLMEDLSDCASIDKNSVKIEVQEVTINVNTDREFWDFENWVLRNHKDNQDRFPSGLTSLDVEEIKIKKSSFTLLKRKVAEGDNRPITIPVPGFYEKNCTNIPAKIMFGDGRTWMGIIRFNWKMQVNQDGVRTYLLDTSPIDSDHIAFNTLWQLKYFTGQGILNDRNGLQDFLMTIYGIKVYLPKCIEMDSISHAAGYRLRKSGMFTTNLTIMGGLLNKEVSCADGTWCEEYENLSLGFKAYLIGDIRVGYTNSIVLLSLLMRNIFPDPHVLCTVLQLSQKEAVRWFCGLVFHCLGELGINAQVKLNSETRQELINSLRGYTDTYPRTMTVHPPPEARVFAKLIPDWPTVPYGGARDIHQVVAFFIEQYKVLQELVLYDPRFRERTPANLTQSITEDFIRTVTFGNGTHRDIICPGATACNLQVKDKNKLFRPQDGKLDNDSTKQESDRIDRPAELAILELMRVAPTARAYIFLELSEINLYEKQYSFWLTRLTLYDRIKSMASILLDKEVPGVPTLEDQIRSRAFNVMTQETATRKKDEIIVQNRIRRETLMAMKQARNERSTGIKRVGLQQDVYNVVPGDKLIRNQKARRNKQRRLEYISKLDDYVEQEEWEHLKRNGKNPTRASFKNYKSHGYDLRDVLKQARKKAAAKKNLEVERQDRKGTTYNQIQEKPMDDLRATINQHRENKARKEHQEAERQDQKGTTYSKHQMHPEDENQPGPSHANRSVIHEERTIRVIEISEDEEVESTDAEKVNEMLENLYGPPAQLLMKNPLRAHFMDPRNKGLADRTPVDITQTAKWTGKGKGKGKGKSKTVTIMKPRPAELSSSDSEYNYECDFE